MKIYKTNQEVKKDIKNGVLRIEDDVEFECNVDIEANINAEHIHAAGNIKARDINAWDINARDINAVNINARDINAVDINARDINARDINAWDIKARDISYRAFCDVYYDIKCRSIEGKREPHNEPICLEGQIMYIKELKAEIGKKVKIKLDTNQIVEGEII